MDVAPAGAFFCLGLLLAVWAAAPATAAAVSDSLTFENLPRLEQPAGHRSFLGAHRVPILVTGAALAAGSLIASQVLLHAADRRYELYQQTSDIPELQRLYREARSRDRWSNTLLLTGEAMGAATLVLVWRELGAPSSLELAPRAVPGGAALELRWRGR